MIELYKWQQTASDEMASRIVDYIENPVVRGRGSSTRSVPFVQFLSSITASGKTVVLTDTLAQVATLTAVRPVVLWISRLTVVVEQTLANLEPGGLYNDLISRFQVRGLSDLSAEALATDNVPFLFFATTGTFNIRGQEGRKVFNTRLDRARQSIWDALRLRTDPAGQRRPLIVVYDEAHNLSDQQTDLLLGLEPDAFVLSTATARVPAAFQQAVVEPLKSIGELKDSDLTTVISASKVAGSGLVKQRVDLVGRQSPMEDVVSELVAELGAAQADAAVCGLAGELKAVYVCRTNITEGDDKKRDDPKQPFAQRQAPPILIWRHLVEGLGIDPKRIAVYCDLKVDKAHPLPRDFVLFRGGDRDYANFVQGDYSHIIFNQTLQEGWDDPLVYFAYIDKTLGSTIAAEQIVGRLLRQPGRKHYASERLNEAELFIRVESNRVFDQVVAQTQERLQGDNVPVTITKTAPGAPVRRSEPVKGHRTIPDVATHTEDALEEMARIVREVPDYRSRSDSTVGVGKRTRVQRIVGVRGQATFEWETVGVSSRVSARWQFSRSLRRFHRDAAAAVALDEPKWDALVGVGSPASRELEMYAEQVGTSFVTSSYIEVADDDDEDYVVQDALVRDQGFETFDNAIHAGYSGLNPTLESPFAHALDDLGYPWARNPSRSGFGIPLIKEGGNDTFYPDFVAWAHGDVYAVDTKGSHLQADATRKLVRIRQSPGRPRLHVRFVVDGRLNANGSQIDDVGFSVIGFKPDGDVFYTPAESMQAAAKIALRKVRTGTG